MKTREYEFEGVKYRWNVLPRPDKEAALRIYHQRWYVADDWYAYSVPPSLAAAEALAALIEDMQVQVIAEWECGQFHYRARVSTEGIEVEYSHFDGDGWGATSIFDQASFRAGYEAGKAKLERVAEAITAYRNSGRTDDAWRDVAAAMAHATWPGPAILDAPGGKAGR
jgi:hypothetical protein